MKLLPSQCLAFLLRTTFCCLSFSSACFRIADCIQKSDVILIIKSISKRQFFGVNFFSTKFPPLLRLGGGWMVSNIIDERRRQYTEKKGNFFLVTTVLCEKNFFKVRPGENVWEFHLDNSWITKGKFLGILDEEKIGKIKWRGKVGFSWK